MMRSENGQTRMNGKVKRLPFDVACKSGPTQERKREQERGERVNGSDGINRQRYVPELTKKPSLYKSYTDQEKNKAKNGTDDFLKGGVVRRSFVCEILTGLGPQFMWFGNRA
jgi:hypothetical protein